MEKSESLVKSADGTKAVLKQRLMDFLRGDQNQGLDVRDKETENVENFKKRKKIGTNIKSTKE